MKTNLEMAILAGFDEDMLELNGCESLAFKLIEIVKREVKHECMNAVIQDCPTDGSDYEIITRRLWDKLRTVKI